MNNDSFALQISVLKKKQTNSINDDSFTPDQTTTMADLTNADQTGIKRTVVDYEHSQEGEEGKIYLEDQFEKSERNARESIDRQAPSQGNVDRDAADTKRDDMKSQNFEDSLIEQSQGDVDENDNGSA